MPPKRKRSSPSSEAHTATPDTSKRLRATAESARAQRGINRLKDEEKISPLKFVHTSTKSGTSTGLLTLTGFDARSWGWVNDSDTLLESPAHLTQHHRRSICAFTPGQGKRICPSKYKFSSLSDDGHSSPQKADKDTNTPSKTPSKKRAESDVIMVLDSDDDVKEERVERVEEETCSKKACKFNPQCLNYLGQIKWIDEGMKA
jgi:hypothetical protein